MFPFDADEIEALCGVGRIDEAMELTAELERRARALERPRLLATSLRCRGLLAAARGDLESAISVLGAALVEHGRLSVPLERGRTLLVLGSVQRRAHQKRAARQTLDNARDLFEQIGVPLWRHRAVEELARIGGRAPSRGTLTAGEQRIAQLAAEGRSNKEIAATLFLSVNTVESTLSRTYSKLGIRSRTCSPRDSLPTSNKPAGQSAWYSGFLTRPALLSLARMHEASHYIAEMYLSRGSAAPPKPWSGEGVRSLFVFFVPEDELCLYILEAASQDMVTNAGRRAGVPFDRVSAARLVHGESQGS